MKQVIVIHGGTTFVNYEDYLDSLRTKLVYVERLIHAPNWKGSLHEKLGADYQVLQPSMPNKQNARYEEWKIWFGRVAEVASDDCILIGHSMGGIFLAKYLSEEKFPKNIAATILVAAPFNDESTEDLGDFKLDSISDLFKEQAGEVIFFHGSDDPVVAIKELGRYQAELPNAEYNIMSAPDHFQRPEFTELASRILDIS